MTTNFEIFKNSVSKQIDTMITNGLFVTDVSKEELWNTYLESFPDGTNNIYKERREYDCNACKNFIRHAGNIVSITKTNSLISIWDINKTEYDPYNIVAKKMSELVKSQPIKDIFLSKFNDIGTKSNIQLIDNKTITWEHFYYFLPQLYVVEEPELSKTIAQAKDLKHVFMRSMEELTVESGNIILELIKQGSLYRGEEFKNAIVAFLKYKNKYKDIPDLQKDNWCWLNSNKNPISKIRNTAIGTLLIDLSNDMEVDEAVTKFEKVMAPSNYKRPKAIFTKKMVEDAEKKIEELGFSESLSRRFAKLSDITVNNLIFVNRDSRKKLKESVFDELKSEIPNIPKNFERIEEVSIEDFINNIITASTSIGIMPESKHFGNFMSLIAPVNVEAKTMFKWNNNFSWAYNGDIADSIKQNVKNAGGNINGVLRFSIQWNENNDNRNDFDAHCHEPNGNHIHFPNAGQRHSSSGMLDVDIIHPGKNKVAVENIVWTDLSKMQKGRYIFLVHNYTHRGGQSGFRAQIEFQGQIYDYEYNKDIKNKKKVIVAIIEFDGKNIKFLESLESQLSQKNIWGIKTNTFSNVNVIMFSPNYWDKQTGIGNKHYFFFIEGCKNDGSPRGFFNEFLNEELTPNKKVFEALGSKMRVEESDVQLSGLGFSSTQKNEILVKIQGSFSRTIKIIF